MKVMTPERGEIVQSTQGRDKGEYFVVVGVVGNTLVLADGVKRTLDRPKRKNVKHVRLLPANVADYGVKFPWNRAFDCDAQYALKTYAAAQKK